MEEYVLREVAASGWPCFLASNGLVAVALQHAVVVVDDEVCETEWSWSVESRELMLVSRGSRTEIKDGRRPVRLGRAGAGIALAVDHRRPGVGADDEAVGRLGVGAVDALVEMRSFLTVSPNDSCLITQVRDHKTPYPAPRGSSCRRP